MVSNRLDDRCVTHSRDKSDERGLVPSVVFTRKLVTFSIKFSCFFFLFIHGFLFRQIWYRLCLAPCLLIYFFCLLVDTAPARPGSGHPRNLTSVPIDRLIIFSCVDKWLRLWPSTRFLVHVHVSSTDPHFFGFVSGWSHKFPIVCFTVENIWRFKSQYLFIIVLIHLWIIFSNVLFLSTRVNICLFCTYSFMNHF
jgi:hypothetical protein